MRAARKATMGKISKDIERQDNASGYEASRLNALKHGILSKHTVLPWEDRGEYDELHQALIDEHRPHGITEAHLVEEISGIIWRKRRLRLAEAAIYRHGLKDTVEETTSFGSGSNRSATAALITVGQHGSISNESVVEAIYADKKSTDEQIRVFRALLKKAEKAIDLLRDGEAHAYEKALKALDSSTREWWEETVAEVEDEAALTLLQSADELAIWVETEAVAYFQRQLHALTNRDIIREQAIGDAFKPARFEQLARYETHLDRKFERTLAMLVKLQELRRDRDVRVLMAIPTDEESSSLSDTA